MSESEKIWNSVFEMKWKRFEPNSISYLTRIEINKQRKNLSKLEELNSITNEEKRLLKFIIKLGETGYYDVSSFKYKQRNKAANFLQKKEVRKVVFNKYGKKCIKCKSLKNIQIDHILPISKNGKNEIDNLQPLCRSCNLKKGIKVIDYRN